jgi:uncharacterized protein (TIGR02145 family)
MKTLFLIMVIFAGISVAGVKNVAVVETEIDRESGAKVTKAENRVVTAELRRVAVNSLPRGEYNVMTSETVIAQGSAFAVDCNEENCVIALGSKIGADYIVRGTVSKLGTKLTLSVEMYETENGNLVASSAIRAENITALVEKIAGACAEMYSTFAGIQEPEPVSVAPAADVRQQSGRGSSATFTDSRNGKTYRTVTIGKQTWMAENLNYQIGKSWCYENNNSNCNKYGRLYDWNTAMTACPAGWHLPTYREWVELAIYAGGSCTYGNGGMAGKTLKSTSGWYGKGNGIDDYGFSALPGGYYYGGDFYYAGDRGYWWTATESGSESAYSRDMYYYYDCVYEGSAGKGYGYSVRCLRD